MSRKTTLEIVFTFLISVLFYVIIDFNFIFIAQWDLDKIINLLHLWVTLISSYYLYYFLLKYSFNKWKIKKLRQWFFLLSSISFLIFVYAITLDIAFYKLYYKVDSLLNETTFYDYDIPIALVILTLGSLYFYQQYYFSQINNDKNVKLDLTKKIKVKQGNSEILIAIEDIAIFYIENGITRLQSVLGEKYYTDDTLSSVISMLNSEQFFRLNRQTIVSKNSIKAFKKLKYQKLEIQLINSISLNQKLIVSKYNAPSFKKWITNSP